MSKIYFLLFLLSIGFYLINADFFVHPSFTNYFTLVIGSGLLLLIAMGFTYSDNSSCSISISAILFLLWALFPLFLPGLIHDRLYYASSGVLFVAIYLFLKKGYNLGFVFVIITVLACIESVYCILQYLDVLKPNSAFFKVTGSSFNPNITAMYLAMSLPAVLYIYWNKPLKLHQAIYAIPFVLIGLAISILQCRTAIIAILMAIIVIAAIMMSRRIRLKYLLVIGVLLCGLFVPIGKYLYGIKKESADGRILVWKISLDLIKEKPLLGYGVGSFGKVYNLKQASYIKENKLTEQESTTASYVNMAYSDYLEQAVEAGIPFMLLYILTLVSLLSAGIKKNKDGVDSIGYFSRDVYSYGYLGVLIFAFMGLTNFTIKAIPAFCLFCIYAACLGASPAQISLKVRQVAFQKWGLIVIALFTVMLLYIQINRVNAHYQHKKAVQFYEEGKYEKARQVMQNIATTLKDSEGFNKHYGGVLFKQGKVSEALSYFNYAKSLSSSPFLYEMSSLCHYRLGEHKQALFDMQQAVLLSPKKMLYKYRSMKMLEAAGQHALAIVVAKQILQMKPVRLNKKVQVYQQEARLLLKNMLSEQSSDKATNEQ